MTQRIERLSLLTMVLGFAVLLVPIVATVNSSVALWNHLLAGGAILLLGRYTSERVAESPTRAAAASGASAVLGAWLAASAVLYPAGLALAFWVKVVAGVGAVAIGIATVHSMRPIDLPSLAVPT